MKRILILALIVLGLRAEITAQNAPTGFRAGNATFTGSVSGTLQMKEQSAAGTSVAGWCVLYPDATTHTLRYSCNAGAFADIQTTTTADARYLQLSGGTITGTVTASASVPLQLSSASAQLNHTGASSYDLNTQGTVLRLHRSSASGADTQIFSPGTPTLDFAIDGGTGTTQVRTKLLAGNISAANTGAATFETTGAASTGVAGTAPVGAFVDSTAFGQNVGGNVGFYGKYMASGTYIQFAQIGGFKENAVDGNAASYLAVATRNSSGTFAERFRITSEGHMQLTQNALTAATMTVTNNAVAKSSVTRVDWTNAMVTALGATTAGDVSVITLPAKTIVRNAYVVITGAAGTVSTLTVSLGRTGASYIDYIVASDAKAAANTVYGDASAERGTNLTGYDLPSFTGTTTLQAHFVSTGGNLSTVTNSSGSIFIETATLP